MWVGNNSGVMQVVWTRAMRKETMQKNNVSLFGDDG